MSFSIKKSLNENFSSGLTELVPAVCKYVLQQVGSSNRGRKDGSVSHGLLAVPYTFN